MLYIQQYIVIIIVLYNFLSFIYFNYSSDPGSEDSFSLPLLCIFLCLSLPKS